MVSPRVLKLAEDIKVIAAEMLKRRIKDPRLGFVTVTDVRLTGDSRDAQRLLHRVRDARGAGRHGGRAALGDRDDPVAGRQAAGAEVHPDAGVRPRRRAGDGPADRGPAGARPRTATRRWPSRRPGRRTPGSRTRTSGPRTTTTRRLSCQTLWLLRRPPRLTSRECWSSTSPPAGRPTRSSGRARRLLGTRKVGHAGTLDPMATGVLVARGRPGHPAARSARADRQGVRRHDPARSGDGHRRRRGRA